MGERKQTFTPAVWRLIQSPPLAGAWNMAIDEALLESAGQDSSPPTLRLYAWEPACLSLGYAQPLLDVDPVALGTQGWELVRRPTGGRAILHVDELTYSVTGPLDEPRLAGSVLESYRTLSAALLNALQHLGIDAQALPKNTASEEIDGHARLNPVCFEAPSNYEITVAGKKLVGSAQARRKDGLLQHGSLPLHGDLRRITRVLAYSDAVVRQQAADRLAQRAATVKEILGQAISWESAARAFTVAFQETLQLELQPGELSPPELKRARQLHEEKYANPAWNARL